MGEKSEKMKNAVRITVIVERVDLGNISERAGVRHSGHDKTTGFATIGHPAQPCGKKTRERMIDSALDTILLGEVQRLEAAIEYDGVTGGGE